MARVCAYIDGFNLYYGSLRGSSEKWLDVRALLLKLIRKSDSLEHIRYFTAKVTDRDGDTGPRLRQLMYLRALATLPDLTIHYGQFFEKKARARLVKPSSNGDQTAVVWKTEEKGSDVNIATYLLIDGFKGRYDAAIVVSNDSDLVEPIRCVRSELGKPVAVFAPTTNNRQPSVHLTKVASYVKEIRRGPLRGSQFHNPLHDRNGPITKPPSW